MRKDNDLDSRVIANPSGHPLVRLIQSYQSPYFIGMIAGSVVPFSGIRANKSYQEALEIANVELGAQRWSPSKVSRHEAWRTEREGLLLQYKALMEEKEAFLKGIKTGSVASWSAWGAGFLYANTVEPNAFTAGFSVIAWAWTAVIAADFIYNRITQGSSTPGQSRD